MGRYYNGDIEGKFWFGVQSSDDPSYFGGEQQEPNVIEYYFSKETLPKINAGLKVCIKMLGTYKVQLDKFFKDCGGYNDDMVAKALKVPESKVKTLLEWYARLELGEKIKKCVVKNGSCSFEAEL